MGTGACYVVARPLKATLLIRHVSRTIVGKVLGRDISV